jgi:DNA-directed RNA polymerase subunit RPC12/RpoP
VKQQQISRYHCKTCGSPDLRFDPDSQKLRCQRCDSEFSVEEYEERLATERTSATSDVTERVSGFTCPACGASVTVAKDRVATACPYCGSHYTVEAQTTLSLTQPDGVIPFACGREQMRDLFLGWVKRGWFRPSKLKKMGRMAEARGIYIPFWAYDTDVYSHWTATSGDYYYVTQTYATTDPHGRMVTRTRQVRRVRWYPSSGHHSGCYRNVTVSGSRNLEQRWVDKLLPFPLGALKDYDRDYFAGWEAEDFTVEEDDAWCSAQEKVTNEEDRICSSRVPGDTYRDFDMRCRFFNISYKRYCFPIWFATYRFRRRLFHVFVNGFTGEIHGEKPISIWKVLLLCLGVAALALLLYTLFKGRLFSV